MFHSRTPLVVLCFFYWRVGALTPRPNVAFVLNIPKEPLTEEKINLNPKNVNPDAINSKRQRKLKYFDPAVQDIKRKWKESSNYIRNL